jgi:WD40 repeat protein
MTAGSPTPLDAVVAAYLQAQQDGKATDRTALLARHPQWADELKAFFADCDRFRALLTPLTPLQLADAPTAAETVNRATENHLGRAFGDYDLLDVLGQGGMGVVYRARQRSLGRLVTVKTLHGGVVASEAERQRFRAEAETVAALQHPHIVPLYEAGEHDGVPFFSLELIEGGSLSQALDRFRESPRAAARLVATAARAVHFAHARGVLHRDLKPGNILIDDKGEPRVTDFGLARRQERGQLTLSGAIVGTPEYVAPEQARGEKALTTAVDVYGLGAVLYATLTGRPPFQGGNAFDTLTRVLGGEPAKPRQINPAVPGDLETICLKCLRKEPERRYPSAQALAEDLERWLAGEPIEARRTGALERGWKWVRRRPAQAALLAVSFLAVLALVGAAVASRYNSDLKQANRDLADAVEKEQQEREKADRLRVEAESQRRRADRFRHAAMIHGANLAGKIHDVGGMMRTLDALVPRTGEDDLRSFEWYYLRALAGSKLARFPLGRQVPTAFAHLTQAPAPVASLFSSSTNGARTARVSEQGVTVRDRDSRPLHVVRKRRFDFSLVALSPDGRRLACVEFNPNSTNRSSQESDLVVWKDGKSERSFQWMQARVEGVCFSPSGGQLAVWFSGKAAFKVLDLDSGKQAFPVGSSVGAVVFAAYNQQGNRLAVTDGQGITLIDPRSGEIVLSLELPPSTGRRLVCRRLAFSQDGLLLAAALARVQKGARPIDEIVVWNFGPAFTPTVLPGPTSWSTADFTPDGRRVAHHRGAKGLVVSDLGGVESLTLEDGRARAYHVQVSPDGRWVAAATQLGPRLWHPSTGKRGPVLTRQRGFATRVAFSPDSLTLAVALEGGSVALYQAVTGKLVRTIDVEDRFATLACGLSFSPDGRRLAVSGDSGIISIREVSSGREVHSLKHGGKRVNTVSYSPDGRTLASAGDDRTVKVWGVHGGLRTTLEGHRGEAYDVSFTPDSQRVVTTSADRTVRLWDAVTGQFLLELTQHNGPAYGARFSRDGRRLVTTGEDGAVKVIDTVMERR